MIAVVTDSSGPDAVAANTDCSAPITIPGDAKLTLQRTSATNLTMMTNMLLAGAGSTGADGRDDGDAYGNSRIVVIQSRELALLHLDFLLY